jgi:hypothetical protein
MASLMNCALRLLQERSHRSAVAGRGDYASTRHQGQDITIELLDRPIFGNKSPRWREIVTTEPYSELALEGKSGLIGQEP